MNAQNEIVSLYPLFSRHVLSPKNHLYEAFEQFCPHIEYRMWLKLGLSITAKNQGTFIL